MQKLFLLLLLISPFSVLADNTHSIDIERSSSQYLYVSSDLGASFSGNITLECWIRPEVVDGYNKTCVSLADADSDVVYAIYHDDTYITFKREKLGVGSTLVQYAGSPSAGSYIHLVGTYDGTSLRLYEASFGGGHVLEAGPTSASGSGTSGGVDRLKIGGTDTSAETYYDGFVDDVRVWSIVRDITALDGDFDEELCGDEAGLLGYWKLNNSLSDEVGSNTLTNFGSAVFDTIIPFTTDGCAGGGGGVATTTATLTDIGFGLAVLIFIQAFIFAGFMFNSIV